MICPSLANRYREPNLSKRIHIVGCSPRSGTTLLFELMVSCFSVEKFGEHEKSVFRTPKTDAAVHCSKNPQDVFVARPMLWLNRHLWIVQLMRDPRDIVVSRHGLDPNKYWCNLRMWKAYRKRAVRAEGHPRFLTIRYEDLVSNPDAVQDQLSTWAPFLKPTARFSSFENVAQPSARSIEALGDLRPISSESVGVWRQHKPRVAAQLELHGAICDQLVALGYEQDSTWLHELDGVIANNHTSHFPERVSMVTRAKTETRRRLATAKYAIRHTLRRLRRTRLEPRRRS